MSNVSTKQNMAYDLRIFSEDDLLTSNPSRNLIFFPVVCINKHNLSYVLSSFYLFQRILPPNAAVSSSEQWWMPFAPSTLSGLHASRLHSSTHLTSVCGGGSLLRRRLIVWSFWPKTVLTWRIWVSLDLLPLSGKILSCLVGQTLKVCDVKISIVVLLVLIARVSFIWHVQVWKDESPSLWCECSIVCVCLYVKA